MRRFSLRIVLPIALGSFLTLVTLVAYLMSRQLILEDQQTALLQEMRTRLNATQGTVERFLMLRHQEGVKKIISAFGSDLDLKAAFVTDQSGRILASTNYREEGLPLLPAEYGVDPTVVELVTTNMVSRVVVSPDHRLLSGYVSICDPHASGGLRARRCGFLFHQIDLEFHRERAVAALLGQTRIVGLGFALAALMLLLIAHRLITVRVTHIMDTLEQFGRGLRDRRTGLTGDDEVARLGQSVDGLLDLVVTDENALRQSEQLQRAIIDSANASIISTDPFGTIQSFSAGAERMLGYHAGELIGRFTPALIHDELEVMERAASLSRELGREVEPGFEVFVARTTDGEADEREWTYIRKDGTRFTVHLSVTALFDADGSISGYLGVARDVTEEKAVVQRLRLAKQVFESAGEAILVTDAHTHIIDVNPAYLEVTGFSREELIGKTPRIAQSGRHGADFYRAMWRTIETTGRWSGELWDRRKNGEIFPQWLTVNAIRDDKGKVTNYVGIFKDVTQQKEAELELERMAYYDPLTELPNRTLFRDRLEHEIAVAHRDESMLALLFIDLDRFKYVNDSLGHDVGDRLLIEAAQRIRSAVRQSDTVARLGGDEFTVVLPGIKEITHAGIAADKIIQSLQAAYEIAHHEVYIGASVGIALYPHDGGDFVKLTKNADTAMYLAKHSGRGRYKYFAPEMDTANTRRLAIEVGLRSALELGQFSLHYQPKLEIATGQVLGFEVLLRWQHSELGNISPAEFVPIAEDNGLIVPIGEWVLQTACAQLRAWQGAGHPALQLSLNLSARQFQHESLVAEIRAALARYDLSPSSLEFELTESILMGHADRSLEVIEGLRGIGVGISVDDFGTGYSSLSYLKRFPIQTLKIDRSFVRDITTDPNDAAIVRAIISLAENLGLQVVAEGVENLEQSDFLRRERCRQAQGYLYAPPLPSGDALRYLEAQVHPLDATGGRPQ